MFTKVKRLLTGSDTASTGYETIQLRTDREQRAADVPGTLIGVRPHAENDGMASMAGVLQSVHDVVTDWRGRNVSPPHSFELWFDGEQITFWFHAADDRSADAFRRRVATAYSNSKLFVAEGGEGFPALERGDHLAGARVDLRKHHYYPIRHRNDSEGFESNPYGVVTSEMLSDTETRVVVQVMMKPAAHGWADGGWRGDSVDDVAESLRDGHVVGWMNPRVRDASSKEKAAAKIVEQQRGELAFRTNIRVLAASPDPTEAKARARGVSSIFSKYYNASTEQGFEAVPLGRRQELDALLGRMHDRAYTERDMVLTVDELASAAHIPNEEIETPRIDWRRQQSGDRVPASKQRREEAE